MSKACQNQGFIIDGFPKTIDQAKTLFERKIFKKKEISNVFKFNLIKRMTQQKKKAAKKEKMKEKKQNSIN